MNEILLKNNEVKFLLSPGKRLKINGARHEG